MQDIETVSALICGHLRLNSYPHNFATLRLYARKIPPLALQQQFVEIARKADETKSSLKKSIADVEQVIKGLING